MITFFARTNKGYTVVNPMIQSNISDDLPPGIYEYEVVESIEGISFNYNVIESFKVPSKLFGDVEHQSKLVLHSYDNTDKNMGVLFSGIGGTGKSLTAKYICNKAVEIYKYTVILIRDINTLAYLPMLLKQLPKRVVVFIDEFEKMFKSARDQNMLLSYLDGITESNYLYLLTVNKTSEVNEHLLSRPGRIRYHFKYNSLPTMIAYNAIKEKVYLEENVNKILPFLDFINDITYDITDAISNEMNLYPEVQPISLLSNLNISGIVDEQVDYRDCFRISIGVNGKTKAEYIHSMLHEDAVDVFSTSDIDNINYFKGYLSDLSDLSKTNHRKKISSGKEIFSYGMDEEKIALKSKVIQFNKLIEIMNSSPIIERYFSLEIKSDASIVPIYDDIGTMTYIIPKDDLNDVEEGISIFHGMFMFNIVYNIILSLIYSIDKKCLGKIESVSDEKKVDTFIDLMLEHVNPGYYQYFETFFSKVKTSFKQDGSVSMSSTELSQILMDSFEPIFKTDSENIIIKFEPKSNEHISGKNNKGGEPKKD